MGTMSKHRQVERNVTLSSWAKEKIRLTGQEISILESEGEKIQEKLHLKADRRREQGINMTEAVFRDEDSDSSVIGSGKEASKDPEISSRAAPITPCAKMMVYTRGVTVNGRKRINAF